MIKTGLLHDMVELTYFHKTSPKRFYRRKTFQSSLMKGSFIQCYTGRVVRYCHLRMSLDERDAVYF